ncbi:hypothetical protein H0A36_21550 [Endozoicomonas sp. SM1973]|uniref:DUF6316 domain-containing protein n=1 Tax=Spartinivicinus marinus TaxID=2994442 RepID=A0A853IHJ9_9GAMM|nr:DUF6316 family protein [Spartinivicinus marinus]MCX4027126.1 DUF6316 family protein [Spartinivicinus marinus]NYZ68605.1 hypothetical protein [Spartinivicinus marinus]
MKLRKDDNQSNFCIYARRLSDRYFKASHGWYFYTREGETIGPYYDKNSAVCGVNDYIEFLSLASSTVLEKYFKYAQKETSHSS